MLEEIHGLAFTPDGKGIIVAARTGFMVYEGRRWKKLADTPQQFGGVSVTQNAAYATARRAADRASPQSGGLLRSTDGGLTWNPMAESGDADFPRMAAGFRSSAVYLVSIAHAPQMPEPGLYHTQDDGKTWQRAAAQGLPEGIADMAAHPTDPRTVAAGASDGVYVSRDSGATFKLLHAARAVTAVFFDARGADAYVAREGVSALDRVSLDGERTRTLAVPIASRDSITHVAQNPARPHEIVVATRFRSVFLSTNGGSTWRTIAREGLPA